MNYTVEIKNIESIRIAYMQYKGVVTESNKFFPNVFKSIKGNSNGSPFLCYYSLDKKSKIGELELCVPTNETPNKNGISVKETPRIKALCTTHIGSYENLFLAYEAITQYALEHSISLKMPFREVYIKGPGMFLKGNPNKYITEIIFPIEEVR
ncbi:effector-binding domain-containing protein [Clostridium cavendishii DSM 21758]|uniref:Effector-binding domain-containing protein n=1 Tax=Clostridium cavendishii DSM 21758 TaxID=1121302 RepID=A0A1M6FA92_9CLOT|nr:GyrI-like domain-containing protein [Clostridium cavendishii]SHI94585.1 effector-binding domain-containing protein [Clostridium cavendishii DSM 21758]